MRSSVEECPHAYSEKGSLASRDHKRSLRPSRRAIWHFLRAILSATRNQVANSSQFGVRLPFLTLLAAMLLFLSLRADIAAQDPPPQAPAKPVPVQWLSSPGAPARDVTMLHFRKEIELAKVPEHFLVDVTADNRFLLMVNQQRV